MFVLYLKLFKTIPMKKLLLLFTLLISTTSFTQNFEITKGEILKDKKRNSFLKFALNDEKGGLITVRGYLSGFPIKKIRGYYIQHFDKELKLKSEYTYQVKKNRLENAFVKDGKLHLIEFEHQKKEDKLTYRALVSDIDSFDFTSKEILTLSEENVKKYFGIFIFPFFINNGVAQMDGNHLGEVVMSKNKNFFVINFDIKDKKKETHKIFVFNNKLELVYDKLITKDIKDRLFEYNSIEVDDKNGAVYFLGKSFENNSKRKKKKGKTNYHFELSRIDNSGEKTISFKNPDKFIGSLSIVKNNDKLYCIGFYGNRDEERYNGVSVFKLNTKTLALESKKFSPFSETFLSDKYGNKEGKKKRKQKKGLKDIVFKNVEITANGDLVISAEEDYITTHSSYNANGGWSHYTVQHYDDIISLRLDDTGNLKWARNINKRQTGYSNSSFTPASVANKTHFFINCSDNIKKLRDDRIQFKQTSAKKSNLYVITIDDNGKFNYKKLIDRKDSEVFYKVNDGIVTKSNEVILLGKRRKKSQIIKVKI